MKERARNRWPKIVCLRLGAYKKKVPVFYESLSCDEKRRADRLLAPAKRDQFIIARFMLRSLVARRLRIAPEKVVFSYDPHGKPQLDAALTGVRPKSPLCFNLSHSGGLLVLGFGPRRFGVDVEKKRKIANAQKVAAKIMSASELAAFRGVGAESQRGLFLLRVWTRKESVLKALGCGLRFPMSGFQVWRAGAGKAGVFLSRVKIPLSGMENGVLVSEAPMPRGYVGAMSVIFSTRSASPTRRHRSPRRPE